MNEKLLSAWLQLSMTISNERIASELPYHEAIICRLLAKNEEEHPDEPLTASDLCQEMRMLKSQMNRTLTRMEKAGMIFRKRSDQDQRRVLLYLNPDALSIYEKQHGRIMQLVDALISHFGNDKVDVLIEMLQEINEIAKEVFL